MKNMKYGRTLLALALVLVVLGSVVGGTIAWFTDEVTSTTNVIKSGTLDVGMTYQTEYDPDGEWLDASNESIFNYGLWEPGYTQVRYLKIENLGDLAFKYQLRIKPTVTGEPELDLDAGETSSTAESKLAEVIDVYMMPITDGFTAPASFADIPADAKIGTLFNLISNGIPEGYLLPKNNEEGKSNSVAYCIALHMQESAGNEYQNLSIRDGFAVQLSATQYTYEEDSFDDQYDADINFAEVQVPAAFVRKLTDEELAKVLEENPDLDLDVSYVFITTDTPAQASQNMHSMWHADYVVTFDKDIYPNEVQLVGNYGEWGWISIPIDDFIIDKLTNGGDHLPAGTPVRLLKFAGELMNNPSFYINYSELCEGVIKFTCGTAALNDSALGTKMDVELVIYQTYAKEDSPNNSVNDETGYELSIGEYSYIFK